jgi:hypothetical protein
MESASCLEWKTLSSNSTSPKHRWALACLRPLQRPWGKAGSAPWIAPCFCPHGLKPKQAFPPTTRCSCFLSQLKAKTNLFNQGLSEFLNYILGRNLIIASLKDPLLALISLHYPIEFENVSEEHWGKWGLTEQGHRPGQGQLNSVWQAKEVGAETDFGDKCVAPAFFNWGLEGKGRSYT